MKEKTMKAKEKEIIIPDADEIVHQVEGTLNYQLDLSESRFTARYHNDLANQICAFILVKNVIDKLLVDRAKDPKFKKEKPSFRKMSYQLNEFISGMSEVMIERIIAQNQADEQKKTADDMNIKIVKDIPENLKKT